jgi:predicted nucleic acid-binding protein
MRTIFADTGYWIATISPRDELHDIAMTVAAQLGGSAIVTSEMILAEVLNAFAWDTHLRKIAAAAIEEIMDDPRIEVVPQTRRLFQRAFDLYRDRGDQSWSLTDCASFIIMDERGITEALTHDRHFAQKGYTALLRIDS